MSLISHGVCACSSLLGCAIVTLMSSCVARQCRSVSRVSTVNTAVPHGGADDAAIVTQLLTYCVVDARHLRCNESSTVHLTFYFSNNPSVKFQFSFHTYVICSFSVLSNYK